MSVNNFSSKPIILAMLLCSALFITPPAFSAQKDVDLLNSYIGNWKGSGKLLTDGNSETIRCKLSVTDSPGSKIGYKGRCAVAGANISIAGTMAFIEEKKRFEAVMSSSTSFSGVAIGNRIKNGINFYLKDRNAETGDKYEIKSSIDLNGDIIGINFSVTNTTTNRVIKAKIPFSK